MSAIIVPALSLGATYIARSFSGDKEQLVPLLKGAIKHSGFSLVDVISPCVTFNDHEGSTKSYAHTRDHYNHVSDIDYIHPSEEVSISYKEGESMPIKAFAKSRGAAFAPTLLFLVGAVWVLRRFG